jgi:hypothetical protein
VLLLSCCGNNHILRGLTPSLFSERPILSIYNVLQAAEDCLSPSYVVYNGNTTGEMSVVTAVKLQCDYVHADTLL